MLSRALLAAPIIAVFGLAACDDPPGSRRDSGMILDAAPSMATPSPALASSAVGAPDAALLYDVGTPGGFAIEPLARAAFPDMIDASFRIKLDGRATNVVRVRDPSDVLMVKLTFQEGGSVGWHTHPGPAIVAVQSGTVGIINASDCVLRHYGAGMAFIDPGQGNVHVGFNAAAGETVAFVMFLDVPSGQGPTIAADDPGC